MISSLIPGIELASITCGLPGSMPCSFSVSMISAPSPVMLLASIVWLCISIDVPSGCGGFFLKSPIAEILFAREGRRPLFAERREAFAHVGGRDEADERLRFARHRLLDSGAEHLDEQPLRRRDCERRTGGDLVGQRPR